MQLHIVNHSQSSDHKFIFLAFRLRFKTCSSFSIFGTNSFKTVLIGTKNTIAAREDITIHYPSSLPPAIDFILRILQGQQQPKNFTNCSRSIYSSPKPNILLDTQKHTTSANSTHFNVYDYESSISSNFQDTVLSQKVRTGSGERMPTTMFTHSHSFDRLGDLATHKLRYQQPSSSPTSKLYWNAPSQRSLAPKKFFFRARYIDDQLHSSRF